MEKGKKTEFSKMWLIGCIALSLIFTAASYVLAFFDKNPVSELSIAIVETMWGTSGISFVGYVLQNSVRAYTASKFGLPEDYKDDPKKRGDPGGKHQKSEKRQPGHGVSKRS